MQRGLKIFLIPGLLVPLALVSFVPPSIASPIPPCSGPHALILGGGGVTGYAWEIGLLKGLQDMGVDLQESDLFIGTSAGALLASQLASGQSLDDLYDGIRTPRRGGGSVPTFDLEYMLDTTRLWQDADPSAEQRIEVARRAIEATDVVSEDDQIGFVLRNFGVTDWPNRPLVVAATDTSDGAAWLFDAAQGVPMERALAASISLPIIDAPITIGDRRFMDGGVTGSTHFGAAEGFPCLVGITPGGGVLADREIQTIEAQGSRVFRISPDSNSVAARGFNPSDQSRAPASAEAGFNQASSVASELRDFRGLK